MILSINASNFQSWESLSFELKDGVTLIDGWNHDDQTSEGSGKSSVVNALCWGLYGKLPKPDTKVDDVVREGQKSCMTGVEINHPQYHLIIRSRGPNDLYLVDLDGNQHRGKDARETQQLVESIIGMSFETFCQTIYFAQNYPKKFISSTQEERGKILSEIQNLELFDKARKEVMNLAKTEETKLNSLINAESMAKVKIASQNTLIEQQLKFKEQQETARQQRIDQVVDQLNLKQAELNSLLSTIESFEPISTSENLDIDKAQLVEVLNNRNEQLFKLRQNKQNLEYERNKQDKIRKDLQKYRYEKETLSKKRRQLVEFIENPTANCPTCNTKLEKQDTTHAIKELEEINTHLDELGRYADSLDTEISQFTTIDATEIDENIKTYNAEISEIKGVIAQIDATKLQLAKIEVERTNTFKRKDSLTIEVGKLHELLTQVSALVQFDETSIDKLKNELVAFEEELTGVSKLIQDSKEYMHRLEDLKDGFKEVKSYTFNSLLNELTVKTNMYLSNLFEIPIVLRFTNEDMKIETEIVIDGHVRGYGMLSGGQQRRTGLAVDLALSDIVTQRLGSGLNIRILDEYFRDLSENSMQKCLTLLEQLKGSTILIEHNSLFKSIVDNVYQVELSNGVSRSVP